ncbi:MAG TPA: L-histidine N(alpha)-methyltransferase, partial [Burkholderiales bacterium]|nr:L-histidine N(alpha)-methyltransferase [Burkholderiales bacterium]
FERICELPEYYLTRTEIAILKACGRDIARRVDPGTVLVELGSGASEKVRLLLTALRPRAYLGIDISRDFLLQSTRRLAHDYPWLAVHAACADFSQPLTLTYPPEELPRLVFFPGSSIGNFTPEEAVAFLERLRPLVRPGGGLVLGIDLQKNPRVIHAAYNDSQGITAAFIRNVLHRLRREYGAKVDADGFSYDARYNEELGRVEINLVSLREQEIRLDGRAFAFASGERLHSEYSYKYTIDGFQRLARLAGYQPEAVWTDPRNYFSVHYLRLTA